jgi:hypothetical protein
MQMNVTQAKQQSDNRTTHLFSMVLFFTCSRWMTNQTSGDDGGGMQRMDETNMTQSTTGAGSNKMR